jgi:hypothetical protein
MSKKEFKAIASVMTLLGGLSLPYCYAASNICLTRLSVKGSPINRF